METTGLDLTPEHLVVHIADVTASVVCLLRPPWINVESRYGEACAGEFDCQRQADVPKADDPDARLTSMNFPQKRSQRVLSFSMQFRQTRCNDGIHYSPPLEFKEPS